MSNFFQKKQPFRPTYKPSYRQPFKPRDHIPKREASRDAVEQLFSIVRDGDYNKIKNYVSN